MALVYGGWQPSWGEPTPQQKDMWDLIDEHDDWWTDIVIRRHQQNVEAGMVLRPPAFTFPDGTALSIQGRPF